MGNPILDVLGTNTERCKRPTTIAELASCFVIGSQSRPTARQNNDKYRPKAFHYSRWEEDGLVHRKWVSRPLIAGGALQKTCLGACLSW